ncbi:MAG: sulfatase-like hydrolase/transferase [Candidatus Hydrogenedens sp.]|nr:sulfatase-like hydrolase/transferase [Candidatus Hydrogenedens sp.]
MRRIAAVIAMIALPALAATAQVHGVEHVLIVGFDGLSPKGIEAADTPRFDALVAAGAHTFEARAVMPTVSSPNWASMIMGAGPEQHGILGNEWPLPMARLKPVVDGPQGIFPTIFSILREQRPESRIAVIHDWDGFGRLFQRKMVDVIINGDLEDDTANQAAKVLQEEKPTLTFIHFDHVDHALHSEGFMTEPYVAAVAKADHLLGQVLDALDSAGMTESTAIIVTADHGGKDKGHGGNSLDEYTIPWILAGKGAATGKTITDTVNTYDTAATAAYLLGLTPPQAWIGRPVLSALDN